VRIREIRIKNFRSLVDVVLPIDAETTVIIGENNAGKSAVLDALRIALPQRGTGRRGLSISDYDFHLKDKSDDPQKSPPIVIEIELRESKTDEWPNSLISDLNEVIQTDPTLDIDYIYLRMTSQYSKASKSYETTWQFLDAARVPQTTGRAATPGYFSNFSKYVVVFYLSALRDAQEEFSSKSQFWGQLLKAVDIPDLKRAAAEKAIEKLNDELLTLDPSLTKVTETLQKIEKVIIQGVNQSV
jgi:putative ATP-dependent endonuclease of OLD family